MKSKPESTEPTSASDEWSSWQLRAGAGFVFGALVGFVQYVANVGDGDLIAALISAFVGGFVFAALSGLFGTRMQKFIFKFPWW